MPQYRKYKNRRQNIRAFSGSSLQLNLWLAKLECVMSLVTEENLWNKVETCKIKWTVTNMAGKIVRQISEGDKKKREHIASWCLASFVKLCLGKFQTMKTVIESISPHSLNLSIIIFQSPMDALLTKKLEDMFGFYFFKLWRVLEFLVKGKNL